MANPEQAWKQVQELHAEQVRGVIWTRREAARTVYIPGEDENGYSELAKEEGTEEFFARVDKKTIKPKVKFRGVKLEDEDSEIEMWPADTGNASMHGRQISSVQNDGDISMLNYDSLFDDSESSGGSPGTTNRTTSSNRAARSQRTIQNYGNTHHDRTRTQKHASASMGQSNEARSTTPASEVVNLVGEGEVQMAIPNLALLVRGRSTVNFDQSCSASMKRSISAKVSFLAAPTKELDVVQRLTEMEELIAALKVKARNSEFKSFDHVVRIFNANVERIARGPPKRTVARNSSNRSVFIPRSASSGKRKRAVEKVITQGESSYRLRTPDPIDLATQRGQARAPDSQNTPTEASNKEKDDFRTDFFSHKTTYDLINWLNTIRSQSTGYYNTALLCVSEICKHQSKFNPPEPFPESSVLQGAIEQALAGGCDVEDTMHWKEWEAGVAPDS